MKFKKLISIIVILVLMITSISYAEDGADVNVSSYDPHWGTSYASEIERKNYNIARISLWNIKNNTLQDVKNICDIETSSSRDFLFVSNMTKVEIADENGELPIDIYKNIEDNNNPANMYEEQISLPNLIIEKGQSASSFSSSLSGWFSKQVNIKTITDCFCFDEEMENKWKSKELCLIVEPMISLVSHSGILFWKKEKVSCFTCAEIGVITNQELYRNMFQSTGSKNYNESCYKGLPFSCFKVDEGSLTILPPYDTSSSDGYCEPNNSRDMLDMIKSLGCFELVSNAVIPENRVTPIEARSADIEYYTNCWVISSVNVSSTQGFPYQSDSPGTAECSNGAKNNCLSGNGLAKITFTFDSDKDLSTNSYTQSIAIPENGNALAWVKWKTPENPCNITINVSANSEDARLSENQINIEVVDPTNGRYPPNPEATDRNDNFVAPSIANGSWNTGRQNTLEWTTYNYNWHYDWHYICRNTSHGEECQNEIYANEYNTYGSSGGWDYEEEETESGGTRRIKVYWNECNTCSCNYSDVGDNHRHKHCTFRKEDWGWVEWTPVNHQVSITTSNEKFIRSSNSPNSNNSDYSIKSGYGVEFSIDTKCKYKKNGSSLSVSYARDAICPPQYMEFFMPEFNYENYEITSFNSLDSSYDDDNSFELPINPYSQFEQKCHFTPLWYPNGKYVVGVKIGQCFCPAGMLYICLDDISINIEGNAYDDWHIAPERN